jgi:hypothetical protein
MNRAVWSLLLLFSAAGRLLAADNQYQYSVKHHHTLKDCEGTLTISADGVEYKTAHKNDSRKWSFQEIRLLRVDSPTEISVLTYEDQKKYIGKDRTFSFRLANGEVSGDLSGFLTAIVKRPMVLAVLPSASPTGQEPAFEIPVKHLHAITGAMGVLCIYDDRIVFQAAREGDSRIWRLSDINRFSQPDRYRFQIVSDVPMTGGPTEVYNFQLLNELPAGVYDFLWVRLHPSSYYPAAQAESRDRQQQ